MTEETELPKMTVLLFGPERSNVWIVNPKCFDPTQGGGIFVPAEVSPPHGTRVRLHIELAGGYEFDCDATVCWHHDEVPELELPAGFGAGLSDLVGDGRELLRRYARCREPWVVPARTAGSHRPG